MPENEKERLKHKLNAVAGFKELTLDEVLNDPEIEAVTIETDEVFLTKYALMAAKANKHIHMEKPGGTDKNMFNELIDVIKASEKDLQCIFEFDPPKLDAFYDKELRGEFDKMTQRLRGEA